MRVVVVNHISLDDVIQGPGGPDEDSRDGFGHGGWAMVSQDATIGSAMGERMGRDFSWLFGQCTYEQVLGHWNEVGGPFKDGLNNTRKYVVSSDPETTLPWPRSTLLSGEAVESVAALRAQPGGNLVVMGSGLLIQSLLPHGLVDELFLMVHPVVLGSGHRLFGPDDVARRWQLVDCTSTAKGVLLTTYQPA